MGDHPAADRHGIKAKLLRQAALARSRAFRGPVLKGVKAVTLLPPGEGDCRSEKRTGGARGLLPGVVQRLGDIPDRVRLIDLGIRGETNYSLELSFAGDGEIRREGRRVPSIFGASGTSGAILCLAREYRFAMDLVLERPCAPRGAVDVSERCAACGVCPVACPDCSLVLEPDGDALALTFDPEICIGCGGCEPACPEKVLAVMRKTDLRDLLAGRSVLHRNVQVGCKRRGRAIAPSTMLEKVVALMGNDPAVSLIQEHCADCRGSCFSFGVPRRDRLRSVD